MNSYTDYALRVPLSIIILCLFFSHFVTPINAQRVFYNINKDAAWIDATRKSVIKYQREYDRNNNNRSQLQFIKSCIALGLYYEKCFQKKILPDNKSAVKYYEKVTDIGTFPGDEKYYKAAALRNNVCRKLADIYFDGTGIKKNREKSLALALKGSSGYNGFFEYYSQKYFHCKCLILSLNHIDTAYSLNLNPFFYQAHKLITIINDKRFKEVGDSYKQKLSGDSTLNLMVLGFPVASMMSQARTQKALEILKTFFVEKVQIAQEKIIINAEVGGGDANVFEILFTKKNFY